MTCSKRWATTPISMIGAPRAPTLPRPAAHPALPPCPAIHELFFCQQRTAFALSRRTLNNIRSDLTIFTTKSEKRQSELDMLAHRIVVRHGSMALWLYGSMALWLYG